MIVFVGEKRSWLAIQMGVTWDDGALAARPLRRALSKCATSHTFRFVNLWRDDGRLNHTTIRELRLSVRRRRIVVGMGRKVQAKLRDLEIRHKRMVHPAARGAIRDTSNYGIHVNEIITSPPSAYCWQPARKRRSK